jgi:hypothetical protein
MKRFVILAALATLTSPDAAQGHSAHTAPAPAAAPTAATTARFSLDTPVETLMADPAAKAVVEAGVPGIASHASYDMFKTMTLNQLAPMAPDKLTPEVLAKIQTGLAAVK